MSHSFFIYLIFKWLNPLKSYLDNIYADDDTGKEW